MRLLDLFCGAGGCSVGYHRAGFTDIVGVDNRPQPRYPFAFVRADALEYVRQHGHEFDAIHASPPCQRYSKTRKILEGKGIPNNHADLVAETRAELDRAGVPWVMENVPEAPMGMGSVVLCGMMFGLRVYRHRAFESSAFLLSMPHRPHRETTGSHRGYGAGFEFVTVGGHNYRATEGRKAMGIDWMTRDELSQAIPPAYTQYIGRQLIDLIRYRQSGVA